MKSWYQLTNKSKKEIDVLIYDQIGKDFWGDGSTVEAKKFITDIKAAGDQVEVINLSINSPGGNVFEGNVIYNFLKDHQATVNVKVDGIAASIASVVAMSGDQIEMPENAMMMIHDPSGLVIGTAEDMNKMAEALDKIKVGLVSAYHAKSGMDNDEISDLMKNETWFTAQEAVDHGFADSVTARVDIQANINTDIFSNFQNVPEYVKSIFTTITAGNEDEPGEKNEKGESDMEITLELIKNDHPEVFQAIQDEVSLEAARNKAAADELARIKGVQEQLIPGHEALISELMFDGVTTPEQAAVKVLQAEKALKQKVVDDNQADAPDALADPPTDDAVVATADANLPIEKRCKKKWEESAEIQAEFAGDFDAYIAAEKAIEGGKVKIHGAKE